MEDETNGPRGDKVSSDTHGEKIMKKPKIGSGKDERGRSDSGGRRRDRSNAGECVNTRSGRSRDRRTRRGGGRRCDEESSDDHDSLSSDSSLERGRRRKKKDSDRRHDRDRRRKKRRRRSPSSSSSSDSPSSSSDSSSDRRKSRKKKSGKRKSKKGSMAGSMAASTATVKKEVNARLLEKLSRRGETLEEREERRAKRREVRITARFGYTAEENPFNDPNLHETFSWKKKEEKQRGGAEAAGAPLEKSSRREMQDHTFEEIDKVRKRRCDRELHFEEMERIRAEESRMKELENYDEWARKEEEFHLQQQRQRSAIRLVEGREKPVDVLAQNMLLFGLTEEEKKNRAKVKYQEKYSALDELETLEANLDEPYALLKDLKIHELEELLMEINAFRTLEREAVNTVVTSEGVGAGMGDANPVIKYWDALHIVTLDEIDYVKTGGEGGEHAASVDDIRNMFVGQSIEALIKMKEDIEKKISTSRDGGPRFDEHGVIDTDYWTTVLGQLNVNLAKMELSDIHSKMLVRQLEKLETKREELSKKATTSTDDGRANVQDSNSNEREDAQEASSNAIVPKGIEPDFGNLEEELGLSSEIDVTGGKIYAWQDKYRPRRPRYFNRVKTGYDWNAYNKTHYDHDNPPPKIVQGYKFNIFYPDLIDKTNTPQYFLERADSDNFCIIRFHAGPPYEDVAFKVINRQWNRSRKRGFRCTFERGVLSLYVNFASHWYRR